MTRSDQKGKDDRAKLVTAAVLIIGDEILSGRTQDVNLNYISTWLGAEGVQVREARVVPDIESEIVDAVNFLRQKYDYVFTTGGIGPTHDDITADAIARAFGVEIGYHPEAYAALEARYGEGGFNEARKRMARVPHGASLIDNPVSTAPGFQIENVFVMAGIPKINRAMLESVRHTLVGGPKVESRSVGAHLPEGAIALGLRKIQERHGKVSIGSYPFYKSDQFGTLLVVRSAESDVLSSAFDEIVALIRSLGAEPILEDQ